ncbi:MAG: hypothetical protein ABR866_11170 [Candidatus Korobacteraceae bacterium]|jgi:hypothetical protein
MVNDLTVVRGLAGLGAEFVDCFQLDHAQFAADRAAVELQSLLVAGAQLHIALSHALPTSAGNSTLN